VTVKTEPRASAEQRVRVSLGERSYDILIKAGLLGEVGPRLHQLGLAGKVAVVTNPLVGRLYASIVRRSLQSAGYQARTILVPEGEQAKSFHWLGRILDELVRARFERGSVVLALGGGVVGDLAGFAASILARGIPLIQVPTTLVAQVDSSVGGKTGVNHPLGKNLIGAFYQPRAVFIDPDTLGTLPTREWVAGLAEVIKYGMIEDEAFFAYLEGRMGDLLKMQPDAVVRVIARSCEIKASVVEEDERESGRRRVLNYGHTIGHALESLGRYRRLIHGEAVAIGMVQEADLARSLGLCSAAVVARQRELVRRAGLPDALPPVRFAELWGAMQHDKKVAQGRLHCVLPKRIGQVVIVSLEQGQVTRWFRGLKQNRGAQAPAVTARRGRGRQR
jgi:3-dehydroquinate synthase